MSAATVETVVEGRAIVRVDGEIVGEVVRRGHRNGRPQWYGFTLTGPVGRARPYRKRWEAAEAVVEAAEGTA